MAEDHIIRSGDDIIVRGTEVVIVPRGRGGSGLRRVQRNPSNKKPEVFLSMRTNSYDRLPSKLWPR